MELMVVIAIMSVLTVLTTPSFINDLNRKRSDVTIQETQTIVDAARAYRASKGTWPGNATCSDAINVLTTAPAYLSGAGAYNKFLSAWSTSCTSSTFSVDQQAVQDWDGYIANSLPMTSIVNAATHQLRTTIGVPGSEPAMDSKLSRVATGNAELNRMRTDLLLGNNNITEINNLVANSGTISSFSAGQISATSVNSQNGSITTLHVQDIGVNGTLNANNAVIQSLNAGAGSFTNLNAGNSSITNLSTVNTTVSNVLTAGFLAIAGDSQFNGNATFNNGIINNLVVAQDTGCAPNGAVARDGTGKPLSCQSGVWRANGGVNTQVVSCAGAVGQIESTCNAYCPAGTKVVGGGCDAGFLGWKLVQSRPEGNGWFCDGTIDYGTSYYNYSTRGYAICAN